MLKEYQILIKDHGLQTGPLWITGYKVVKRSQYIVFFSESRIDAAYFDEDDYILEICKDKFKDLEIFGFDSDEDKPKEIIAMGIA